MMKLKKIERGKYTELFSFLITLLGFIGLVAAPKDALDAAKNGIGICTNIIIPTLFPFFVFSMLFISLGLADIAGKCFEKLMRPVFNLSGACSSAILLGLLSGFPVGAKTAVSLYQKDLCSKTEAERTLAFCNNAGPSFVLGTVGAGIWKSGYIGWLLWFSQTISAMITGMIFGRLWKGGKDDSKYEQIKKNQKPVKLFGAFVDAVRSSAVSVVYICAFIIFFAVVVALLQTFGIIPAIAGFISKLLPFVSYDTVKNLIAGLFEMTTGVTMIGNSSPFIRSLTLTGAVLGWAGISVHCQVLTFVYDGGLSSRPYIYGKIMQTFISAAVTFLLSFFLPLPDRNTFADFNPAEGGNYVFMLKSFMLCTVSFIVLCCFILIIFNLINYHKKK